MTHFRHKGIVIALLGGSALMLGGCGAAETASVAATQAELAAEQAEQAKKTQARIEADLVAAQKAAEDARQAVDSASE